MQETRFQDIRFPPASPAGRALAGALVIAAGLFLQGCDQPASQAAEPVKPEVTVAEPVVREVVEWDEYTGRFAPVERVEIRARVSGFLDKLLFEEGTLVKRGDRIAVVDQRPFRIAVDRAQAAVDETQAAAELAEIELERARELQDSPAFSQNLLDERLATWRRSTAQLAAAQSALARANLDLEFSDVRAPISGRIGRYEVTEGNLIVGGEQGGTLLTTIVSVDPIYFYFDISEADYLRYNRLNIEGTRTSSRDRANPVRLRLLDETAFDHEGSMDFVDNELAEATATLQGRAVFDNPGGFFQPGQFATARLIGSGRYEAVLVPDDVLVSDQSRKFVYVVNGDNRVERRLVELGPIIDGLRVVREGLAASDRVIVGGVQRVRPDVEVTTQQDVIDAGES